MTSAAQPNPIEDLTADASLAGDARREQQTEGQPEFTGDMPDDPEQAVHYRPGQDGPGGSMDAGSTDGGGQR
jgi:hypothetical protein